MKRSITRWTTTLATAALLGLPAVSSAQTPQPTQPPPTSPPPTAQPPATPPPTTPPPTTQPPTTPPAEPSPAPERRATPPQTPADANASPQEHLRQAKVALDGIQASAVTGRARTQIADLKKHLNALEKASASAGATASPAPAAPAAAGRANANWGTEVAAMDKILTELMGTGATPAAGATAGTTGATGTAGRTGSKAATAVSLDDATKAKLMDVRTHLTAYAAAMAGVPSTPKSDTPKSDDAAAAGATPPTANPAPQEPAAPAAGAQPQAAAAQPTADEDAARRHLTAARDTLAQLTKLPAAAQLTGDARTQVGQLITNFNELITTQSQWRASYAKVAANLDALLGPETGAPSAANVTPPAPEATPPAAPPAGGTPPAATPGAVGTTGTANVELDPGVREKLIELRRNLKEFEKASGGAES